MTRLFEEANVNAKTKKRMVVVTGVIVIVLIVVLALVGGGEVDFRSAGCRWQSC